ncbi:MAG: hypothetical protein ACKN9T_05590 [Candidatus Methylumidiphilus sp.]
MCPVLSSKKSLSHFACALAAFAALAQRQERRRRDEARVRLRVAARFSVGGGWLEPVYYAGLKLTQEPQT